MFLIGVAGGIASGKSTVARAFEQYGAWVIDADTIGHELLKTDTMKKNLVETFGSEILTSAGTIDRRGLGRVVFNNDDARQRLNRIVRPTIRAEIRRRIAEKRAQSDCDQGVIVVDAPLMVETGPTDLADLVILVTASPVVRKARIILRNQLSEEEAEQRITAQVPDTRQAQWADYVLENNGTQEELVQQAEYLWKQIMMAGRKKQN